MEGRSERSSPTRSRCETSEIGSERRRVDRREGNREDKKEDMRGGRSKERRGEARVKAEKKEEGKQAINIFTSSLISYFHFLPIPNTYFCPSSPLPTLNGDSELLWTEGLLSSMAFWAISSEFCSSSSEICCL